MRRQQKVDPVSPSDLDIAGWIAWAAKCPPVAMVVELSCRTGNAKSGGQPCPVFWISRDEPGLKKKLVVSRDQRAGKGGVCILEALSCDIAPGKRNRAVGVAFQVKKNPMTLRNAEMNARR